MSAGKPSSTICSRHNKKGQCLRIALLLYYCLAVLLSCLAFLPFASHRQSHQSGHQAAIAIPRDLPELR
tara:strand:- start:14 stop:220 length:207 start_codon:yes stop_codon:yes gene_type:complete